METVNTLKTGLDFLPKIIVGIREVTQKIITSMNFPDTSFMFVAITISLLLSYWILNELAVTSFIFSRFKNILIYILITLLIYVSFTYVTI